MRITKTTKACTLLLCAGLICPLPTTYADPATTATSTRNLSSSLKKSPIQSHGILVHGSGDTGPDKSVSVRDGSGKTLRDFSRTGMLPPGAVAPAGILRSRLKNDNSKATSIQYGKQYLQVVLEHVHLTRKSREQASYHVTINIGNNKFETIDFNLQEDKNISYSDYGEKQLVPYLALNNPHPMYFEQEVRTLERNSEIFGFLQNIFQTAATMISGPFGASVMGGADRSGSAKNALDTYEQKTKKTDRNNYHWLDDISSKHELPTIVVAVFSRGKDFELVRSDGKNCETFRINERMLQNTDLVPIENNGDLEPDIKTYFTQKTFPRYCFTFKDGKKAYPTGKESYAVLRFKLFDRYPQITSHPEIVKDTASFFRDLDFDILGESNAVLTDTDKKALQKQIDAKGKELISKLQTLTDSDIVSLKNAHELVEAFCQRAEAFKGGDTGFDPKYLLSLARGMDVDGEFTRVTDNRVTLEKLLNFIQNHPYSMMTDVNAEK